MKRKDAVSLKDEIEFVIKDVKQSAEVAKGTIPKAGVHTIDLLPDNYLVALKPKNVDEAEMRVFRMEPDTSDSALSVMGPTEVEFELRPAYKKVQFIAYWIKTGAYIGTDTRRVKVKLESVDTPAKDWELSQGTIKGIVETLVSTDANIHTLVVTMTNWEDLAKGAVTVTKPGNIAYPGCRIDAIDEREGWLETSRIDLQGRCALMADAIVKANQAPFKSEIKDDADVLKIFMAPEFYFRGVQGAYPFECLEEILKDPTLEAAYRKSPDYDDWLFVLGSGIGAIDGKARTDHAANVTAIPVAPVALSMSCRTGSPSSAVAPGWKLWVAEADGSFKPQPGVTEFTIAAAPNVSTFNGTDTKRIEFAADFTFARRRALRLWAPFEVTLSRPKKVVVMNIDCAQVPVSGWVIKQGLFTGTIVSVISTALSKHFVAVELPGDENLVPMATTTLSDSSLFPSYPGAVDSVSNTNIEVDCPGIMGSVLRGWRLRISNPAGTEWPADAGHNLEIAGVTPLGGTKRRLTIGGTFDFVPGQKFAVWEAFPERFEPTKTIWIQVNAGATVPQVGWAILQGTIKGAIVSVSPIGLDYHLLCAVPVDSVFALGPITLAEPGDVEIINIAPVTKGGKGAPVSAEGRVTKEFLVYKETISSVDFQTFDYGGQFFYGDLRHMIEVHGDSVVRAFPTEGSTDRLARSPQKSGDIVNTRTISEQSITGLGGGTVFTMDGITFGIEVCLDHGSERL